MDANSASKITACGGGRYTATTSVFATIHDYATAAPYAYTYDYTTTDALMCADVDDMGGFVYFVFTHYNSN